MLTREYFEKNSAIWCILKRILFYFNVKYLKNIDIHIATTTKKAAIMCTSIRSNHTRGGVHFHKLKMNS